jgi:pantothenate kinase
VFSLARFLWLQFCSLSYKDAWNVLQIVNIGSGVSVLAVYGPSNYRRISGTRSVIMFLSCFLIHTLSLEMQ